ncbi:MAG: acyltransferase [Phormidesmis sp. CAN_BIN36]|nr:acyltransferase [Phormidesmis sp. CAN_BIN36]
MSDSKELRVQRLAWLEGMRIFAAIMLLLYHSQLLFTKYVYTPQPTGLVSNGQQILSAARQLGSGLLTQIASVPIWFGFQFVDVFVLMSGFSLVLSLKGNPLEIKSFLKRRSLRILLPFWTVAWLAYPVLWAIGKVTNSYAPDAWRTFAGLTFPLLFDYGGSALIPTSGPWWFIPLILSFTFVFPSLWGLLQRWGARNLLIISTLITLIYRAFAVYVFGGHPTYTVLDTPTDWQPFLPFIAKLSTFVLGMVVAQSYLQRGGVVYWKPSKALLVGIPIYGLGFICQFYRFGWIFSDFLVAIGLSLCCMVIFRAVTEKFRLQSLMVWLGIHSYSYFLIHDFVVDRTINLAVGDQLALYYQALPVMAIGTLLLAILADSISPWLQRVVINLGRSLDSILVLTSQPQTRHKTLWVSENDLEPSLDQPKQAKIR